MKKQFLTFATAVAFGFALTTAGRAHEEDAEDKSPMPVTLGGTWQALLKKQAELQGATASQSLPSIHKTAFRLRDLCNTLPDKSRELPADKLARVAGAAKSIAKLADELDRTGDAKDQAGTEANLKKLDGLLKLLANQYDPEKLADTSKEPPPGEATATSKEHAHSDHESKRGGVLMMKDDLHIEGVQVDNQFRVYFFNEFTRPIPVGKIAGKLVLPLPAGAKSDAEEPTAPLQLSGDGMYLWAGRPAKYPDEFLTVSLLIDGQEGPFSFPIYKTSDAVCTGCGTKTVAGPQAVSACGLCAGKLMPKDAQIACSKCTAPVAYNAALAGQVAAPKTVGEPSNASPLGDGAPIQGVLENYYAVQKALAADDLKSAQSTAEQLASKAGKLAQESNEAKVTIIAQSARALAAAKDIKQARKAFGDASQALIEHLGQTPAIGSKYYILHCPMAKVGNGDWIQQHAVTSNPYFGGEMLRCGSVKKEVK